jgi:hypothetical protein
MHRGGPFDSRALRGARRAYARSVREREMTAQRSSRASVLTRVARCSRTLRGGDAEGLCLYAIGKEVSWTRVRIDAATWHTWACQRMVPTWRGARELEARWAAHGVNKEVGSRGAV